LVVLEPSSSQTFKFYTAAAVLIPSIIPYTLGLMVQTNNKLLGKADSLATTEITDKAAEAGATQEETVHALIDMWATLNLGQAIIRNWFPVRSLGYSGQDRHCQVPRCWPDLWSRQDGLRVG
jgi:hypothetical protein